jgi:hypothetical protein
VGGRPYADASGRRRLHRRFGKAGGKKAAVAIAHTILVIVWHVLQDQVPYTELGADYYTQRDNPEVRNARLVRRLAFSFV